jgi:hypothetical protein
MANSFQAAVLLEYNLRPIVVWSDSHTAVAIRESADLTQGARSVLAAWIIHL